MGYREFTFPKVITDLGLAYTEGVALFPDASPIVLPAALQETLEEGRLVSSGINNEKARSEFLIAPLLLEMRRACGRKFGLFSGTELNIDASRGLNGYIDFMLSRDPMISVLKAPVAAIVEAKNDNVWNGYAQCIATMFAASLFNERAGQPEMPIYGASTTGVHWQFFRLEGSNLSMDENDYYFSDLNAVAAILFQIVGVSPAPWPVARPEFSRM